VVARDTVATTDDDGSSPDFLPDDLGLDLPLQEERRFPDGTVSLRDRTDRPRGPR
jgi:hypothetical protein